MKKYFKVISISFIAFIYCNVGLAADEPGVYFSNTSQDSSTAYYSIGNEGNSSGNYSKFASINPGANDVASYPTLGVPQQGLTLSLMIGITATNGKNISGLYTITVKTSGESYSYSQKLNNCTGSFGSSACSQYIKVDSVQGQFPQYTITAPVVN